MKLPAMAINRPVTVVMTFLGLALIGLYATFRLPIEQFPEIEIPYVGIGIPYPNATAQEVERNLTRPVEEVLSTMSGIDRMFTFSRPGFLFVNLSLDFDKDVTGKGIEAKELIEGIRHRLPEEIRYIQLRQEDPNATPVLNVMIRAADLDPDQAYDLLDSRLVAELERLPGVNSVELYGIDREYISIALDPDRVQAYGLDYLDIQRRLEQENFFISAGHFDADRSEYQVRPMGKFEDLEAFRRLPLNRRGIILDDVANVTMKLSEDTWRRRINGERSLGIAVFKRPEANLVAVTREINEVMDKVSRQPVFSNTTFVPLDSQADTILQSLMDLRDSGLLGGLLSVMVLFLFLRQVNTSLLIASTVPLALCGTLGVMFFLDMTLNILSVVGLMLAIGLLVDNSVVVSEAIGLRRRQMGEDARTAAETGVSEVAMAITAGTFTTIIVFVPSFMTDVRQVAIIQQNIALPLCTALLGSLLVAQTLVPTLMARMPIPAMQRPTPFIDFLTRHYTSIITWTLRYRFLSLVGAIAVAASGWFVYDMLDINMNPEDDSPRLQLNYFVRGSMEIEVIESYVKRVDNYLLENRERFEIDNIYSSYDTDRGRTIINLDQDGELSSKVIEPMIMENIPEMPNVRMRFSSHRRGFGGGGGGLGLRIIGDSTEELIRIGDEIVEVLDRIPMLTNVQTDIESRRQELRIRLRPEQAAQMGVTARALSQSVAIALGGKQLRRGFMEDGKETDIFLELFGEEDANIGTLRRLPIFLSDGGTVPLEAVADLEIRPTLRAIRRENRETSINVDFSMDRGSPEMGRAVVEGVMEKFELPPGYRWELGRGFREDREQFREMAINGLIAVALVYMLMASLFESILFPTTVLIAIGYSLVGVFWFLFLTATPLTSMAVTGMVLLGGIVVNNGIVLMNRIMQLRRDGVERVEAILASGQHRLRPILMTVCTTVAGLSPLAIGDVRVGGMGPSYFPMARSLIGGLIFSTVITLIILPLIYVLFDDMKVGVIRFWQSARRKALAN